MPEQSDAEIVAGILKRFAEERNYWCHGKHFDGTDGFLTLDGTVVVSVEELEVLNRVLGDGQGWWQAQEATR